MRISIMVVAEGKKSKTKSRLICLLWKIVTIPNPFTIAGTHLHSALPYGAPPQGDPLRGIPLRPPSLPHFYCFCHCCSCSCLYCWCVGVVVTIVGTSVTSSIPVVQVNTAYFMLGTEESSHGTKEPAHCVSSLISCSDRSGTNTNPCYCVDSQ